MYNYGALDWLRCKVTARSDSLSPLRQNDLISSAYLSEDGRTTRIHWTLLAAQEHFLKSFTILNRLMIVKYQNSELLLRAPTVNVCP